MRREFLIGLSALGLLSLAATLDASFAQRGGGRWVVLGQQTVGFIKDRDVVRIGRDHGWLRAIRASARNNDVAVLNIRLHYQNGYVEDFKADHVLRAGAPPYEVDLRGERSFLKEIEFTYRSKPSFRGRAVVVVEGQVARPR